MKTNKVKFTKYLKVTSLFFMIQTASAQMISLDLHKGAMADYGASPWYTKDIKLGDSEVKLSLDSGANFIWVTSDLCKTKACKAHKSVDVSQKGFKLIDTKESTRSFGPWGSMQTQTAEIDFKVDDTDKFSEQFYASTDYKGGQFEYLAWDGGIGFPSTSEDISQDSSFFFESVYKSGKIKEPSFSIVTDEKSKKGKFYLGGDNQKLFKKDTAITLKPDRKGSIDYIWGTNLYNFRVGEQTIFSLTNAPFYLDSGSSLFKGDDVYVKPILKMLYNIKDVYGNTIFNKVLDENDNWVSLEYANGKGPSDFECILPDITLTIGQSCHNDADKSAKITLSPKQYSYYVEEGDRKGKYVPAFSVLDGVGGLLVGSTLMDLFYTKFNYKVDKNDVFSQGDMTLYQKASGASPASLECVETPKPIEGAWINSFCSQMELKLEGSFISGIYTSHTGSTGSSQVVGWLSKKTSSENTETLQVNPQGRAVALGIQWRLINQPLSEADGTWNWVSNFSGQLHQEQIVEENGQNNYEIPQTLVVTNSLIATATVDGFNDKAPVMWPEDLTFTRIPPAYCEPILAPKPVKYEGTAKDHISGTWKNESGEKMVLKADMKEGNIIGTYTASDAKEYEIKGLADTLPQAQGSKLVQQGLTLVLIDKSTEKTLSMAGGVDLKDTDNMIMWQDNLTSTTWTNRFIQSSYDKVKWIKVD